MSKLISILEKQANYVSDSGYSVDINSIKGTVYVYHTGRNKSIYLQGDDATVFISECTRLYNELEHITFNTVALALAMPYIDSL